MSFIIVGDHLIVLLFYKQRIASLYVADILPLFIFQFVYFNLLTVKKIRFEIRMSTCAHLSGKLSRLVGIMWLYTKKQSLSVGIPSCM